MFGKKLSRDYGLKQLLPEKKKTEDPAFSEIMRFFTDLAIKNQIQKEQVCVELEISPEPQAQVYIQGSTVRDNSDPRANQDQMIKNSESENSELEAQNPVQRGAVFAAHQNQTDFVRQRIQTLHLPQVLRILGVPTRIPGVKATARGKINRFFSEVGERYRCESDEITIRIGYQGDRLSAWILARGRLMEKMPLGALKEKILQ